MTAAVALSAANCAPAEFTVSPLTGGPCDDELAGQCGGVCTVTEDCPAGQYCASGTCLADCTPGGDHCGSGSVCDDEGRCASGGGQGGAATSIAVTATGGGATTSGGEGGSCGAVEVSFEPQVPTVVLLIDQSGSMNVDFNGQGSRWDVVYDALMNPTTGVVKQLEGQVRFGLALYTYANGPTCPELVEVAPPILNHHAAIDAAYVPESPRADTPTGDSITAITAPLMAVTEPGPKLIILATDGEPDRCEDPNAHDQVSRDEATDAAQAAFAQGIETVIIAVGNQVSQEHQQDMANAGSGRPVPAAIGCDPVADPVNCAPTYEPTSKQALIDAFNEIIIGQRTCIFTLDGQVIPGKECDGTVLVNGTVLGCNDPNGWQLNSPTEIEFLGTACDTILNDANADVSVSFPCDSVVVPE
ncbi:MAG: vWA domain-containing protein [Myxococcota bacterium]